MVISLQEGLEVLAEQTEALAQSERWRRWLSYQTKFHQYSFNNVLLIMAQRPEATSVAGYRRWQALGRQVREGEPGIRIIRPQGYKRTNRQGEEVDRLTFRGASVFDISQTDGAPPPEVASRLETSDRGELLQTLTQYAEQHGWSVTFANIAGEANGYAVKDKIVIKDDLAVDQQTKTLLHEIAHHALGHVGTAEWTREEREIEAESVSFVVAGALGWDTSQYSVGYVTTWGDGREAAKVIRLHGKRIANTAKVLITDLTGSQEPGDDDA